MTAEFLPALRRRHVRSRALSLASATVDRGILPVMQRLWLLDGDPLAALALDRLDDLARRYAPDPGFFPEPPSPAIRLTVRRPRGGGVRERWCWRSGYRTWDPRYQETWSRWEENDLGCAELWRHGDEGRPTIVCIHSWATGFYRFTRLAFAATRLYRAGFDVVVPILPFHGPRTPSQAWFGGQLFPGTDAQRTNEAFGQAVWDLRSLVRALGERGAGPISAIGMSLGGYTTAVLASVEPRLHAAVPMIPLVSLAGLLWHHGERSRRRERAEATGVTRAHLDALYAIHCPLGLSPVVPRERRLIVAGRGDRITFPGHVEALWQHWDRPAVHWFPGGHMSHFGRIAAFDAVTSFLRDR